MKFYKLFGIAIIISGSAIVIPQILLYLWQSFEIGIMGDILVSMKINSVILNAITYNAGVFNGSTAHYGTLVYTEYYKLGFLGFCLVAVAMLSVKYGVNLFRSTDENRSGILIKIMFLELAVILLITALLALPGFYYSYVFDSTMLPLAVIFTAFLLKKHTDSTFKNGFAVWLPVTYVYIFLFMLSGLSRCHGEICLNGLVIFPFEPYVAHLFWEQRVIPVFDSVFFFGAIYAVLFYVIGHFIDKQRNKKLQD
jgi:hypothetical protein